MTIGVRMWDLSEKRLQEAWRDIYSLAEHGRSPRCGFGNSVAALFSRLSCLLPPGDSSNHAHCATSSRSFQKDCLDLAHV